ncbi:DUF5677 domain-containing protein [Burkholderia multivorans]|uniref:DUF5677 domain-containing protein n=1 Tax=Burkholderia multivorans TaxID=87883 RepID=UPI00158E8A50|nr:DUF5677 domain-containing protein [Burkholderia multivorans]MDN8102607.1 DUF5677 domain-containing protein [Burkholderia multivorans]
MTGFELDGFLSDEVDAYRLHVTEHFRSVLGECIAASRAAMVQINAIRVVDAELSTLVALSLWSRCIATCQAAILLGHRGMGVDGLTLLRNAFESLFHCGALLEDSSVLARLRAKDDYERLKQATAILGHKETVDVLTPEAKAAVEAFVMSVPSSKDLISAFDCAKLAGLEGLYHSAYRTLSLKAAHPSLTTAGHAFGEQLTDLRFGPSTDHLDEVFGLARDCLNMGHGIVAKALSTST